MAAGQKLLAATYTWHALYTMELETSLLIVDPAISGMPYLDWGAMVDPDVAEIYRRRLVVGVGWLTDTEASDIGEMGSLDVLTAWKAYKASHPGQSLCAGSTTRDCSPRLLLDGSFARWPIPRFDWDQWCTSRPDALPR